jgi:hypothetical protein
MDRIRALECPLQRCALLTARWSGGRYQSVLKPGAVIAGPLADTLRASWPATPKNAVGTARSTATSASPTASAPCSPNSASLAALQEPLPGASEVSAGIVRPGTVTGLAGKSRRLARVIVIQWHRPLRCSSTRMPTPKSGLCGGS